MSTTHFVEDRKRAFASLSLRDLVEARDLFHVHLMKKKNVVATAIGLYLVRREGVDKSESLRLDNSDIEIGFSWPCVLVFVDNYAAATHFDPKLQPDDYVPRSIYMPDGREVPICIVEAKRDEFEPPLLESELSSLTFPSNFAGGGYPVIADVQGQEHVASLGCVVTDGHLAYAITNRHVAGLPGEAVYTLMNGRRTKIGTSSELQITRQAFTGLYETLPGKDVFVNMDVALVEIEDRNSFTPMIYGIGQFGKMADINWHSLSLDLVGCPLRAYGCLSGQMRGRIFGLFYRYKSVGGFDYVADFLIGPTPDKRLVTRPGDSGTIWLLDTGDEQALMPIAIQWGGHVFNFGPTQQRAPYALATGLSNVCRLLGVDLVRDWSIDQVEYWGAVGHYAIANVAVSLLKEGKLKELMTANLKNITFDQKSIGAKELKGLSREQFVPLADVPDLVWKIGTSAHGNRGQAEHPNHFADMDKPTSQGKTLLDICKGKPKKVDVTVWQTYYDEVKDESRGLLPFRVWQFFDAMKRFASAGDVVSFVCAAGIVSHYVGDSCQPLHISSMFDGDPNDTVRGIKHDRNKGNIEADIPRAAGVHSAYEDGMVNRHTSEIFAGVPDAAKNSSFVLRPVNTGHDAAVAVVDLMQDTFEFIHPSEIVNAFNGAKAAGDKPSALADDLWDKFGDNTIQVIANGCRMLAHIWEAAWTAGDGDNKISELGEIDQDKLVKLYTRHDFVPSFTLDQIEPILKNPDAPSTAGTNGAKLPESHDGTGASKGHAPGASKGKARTAIGRRI